MKKWGFLLLALPLLFFSCKKSERCRFTDSSALATPTEITYLQNYLAANSIAATQHNSGMYYFIESLGSGSTATVCSNITVNYTGTLLSNGSVFDSDNSAGGISFILGQVILGWQKGLPVIKSGGRITLYIPPSLGYGAIDQRNESGVVIIPANSYIKFTIDLLDVQ